jgi:uncharacterized protein
MTTESDARGTLPQDQDIGTIQRRLHEALPDLRVRYAVKHLWLFGSRARREEGADSDLDVLVEFSEIPSLFGVIRLENELGELLNVRVDLVMKSALKPKIGAAILQEVLPV